MYSEYKSLTFLSLSNVRTFKSPLCFTVFKIIGKHVINFEFESSFFYVLFASFLQRQYILVRMYLFIAVLKIDNIIVYVICSILAMPLPLVDSYQRYQAHNLIRPTRVLSTLIGGNMDTFNKQVTLTRSVPTFA